MLNILDFSLGELEKYFADELQEKPFRARQVWSWLWQKQTQDFQQMTDVSKALREKLTQVAQIQWPQVLTIQKSQDGTQKFLLQLADGACIETVLIPSFGPQDPDQGEDFEDDEESDNAESDDEANIAKTNVKLPRYALCLSSQVGCAMGCTFCNTARMGFKRNLTPSEILGQILVARHHLQDNRPDRPILRNLVFMGMGEPLLNFANLKKALHMAHDKLGLSFSARRITVSTCGIKQGLLELGSSGLAFLAISLHAPDQDLRARIMPKAAHWQLSDLLTTLKKYPLKPRELITFEYLLLGGVNDSPAQALQLAKLVTQAKGKLNLIAFNPIGDSPYTAPTPEAILAFEKVLWAKGVTAILRKSKGQDISAACGQLYSEHQAELAQ